MRKLLSIAIAIIFINTSCTKIRSTDIGNGLIPPIDGVLTKDTMLDVVTNNFLDDLFSRVYKADDQVIGVISNDPIFGKTHAAAYFEMKPIFFPFSFPGIKDSLKVDSVVLILGYLGHFGDTTLQQTWNVREVNQTFKFDTSFVPERDDISTSTLLGTKVVNFNRLKDSGSINQIRIKLDQNNIKDRLTKTMVTQKAYASDSAFKSMFKGFGVVPMQNVGNALIRINFQDTNTKLAFYYSSRDSGATKRDTAFTYFRFNLSGDSSTSAQANIIKRDRVGSPFKSAIDTGLNDMHAYIQTSPGSYATVRIPGLRNFPNSIIHRAYLIAEQDLDGDLLAQNEKLAPPRYLLLSVYDTTKKRKINVPNDYEVSTGGANIDAFGGYLFYKSIAPYNKVASYEFNLSRYVQGIVTRKDSSYTLRMSAPANDSLFYTTPYISPTVGAQASITYYLVPGSANVIGMGRVRLGGGTNTRVRMRLRIIYSRL